MNGIEMSIFLEKVEFYAYHGVGEQERVVGNTFWIDLRVYTDFSEAMRTDSLDGTISYADIYTLLKEEMAIPSLLLEHVAGRILKRLFDTFATITEVEIRLSKQNPPMGADIAAAGVELCCKRG